MEQPAFGHRTLSSSRTRSIALLRERVGKEHVAHFWLNFSQQVEHAICPLSHYMPNKTKQKDIMRGELRLRWKHIEKCNLEDGNGEKIKADGTVGKIQIQQCRSAFGLRTLPLSRSAVVVVLGYTRHFERELSGQSKVLQHLQTLADCLVPSVQFGPLK